MRHFLPNAYLLVLLLIGLGIAGCSGPKQLAENNYQPSSAQPSKILTAVPDYHKDLHSLKGKGRAIVSEPGNTERVTVMFSSNREKSLVTVRNSIGIEGGQLLTDGDTLLVYNKVDKFARKIPIRGGSLSRINRLASLNLLDMISYAVSGDDVASVLENNSTYKLKLTDGSEVYVDKDSHLIQQVVQPDSSRLPYSKITYEAYATINGYKLPRRISIFGAQQKSKVALQLTALEINPKLDILTINIPDDIPIYNR